MNIYPIKDNYLFELRQERIFNRFPSPPAPLPRCGRGSLGAGLRKNPSPAAPLPRSLTPGPSPTLWERGAQGPG